MPKKIDIKINAVKGNPIYIKAHTPILFQLYIFSLKKTILLKILSYLLVVIFECNKSFCSLLSSDTIEIGSRFPCSLNLKYPSVSNLKIA